MKPETFDHADQSALLNTQQWTPEPWRYHLGRGANPRFHIQTSGGYQIASTTELERHTQAREENAAREANAQRIVACVNACTGIQEPEKAIQGAREALHRIVHSPGVTDDERTQARAALKQLGGKL